MLFVDSYSVPGTELGSGMEVKLNVLLSSIKSSTHLGYLWSLPLGNTDPVSVKPSFKCKMLISRYKLGIKESAYGCVLSKMGAKSLSD